MVFIVSTVFIFNFLAILDEKRCLEIKYPVSCTTATVLNINERKKTVLRENNSSYRFGLMD